MPQAFNTIQAEIPYRTSLLQSHVADVLSVRHFSMCKQCLKAELGSIMFSQCEKDRLRSAAPAAGLHQLQLAGNLGKASFVDFVEEDLQPQH